MRTFRLPLWCLLGALLSAGTAVQAQVVVTTPVHVLPSTGLWWSVGENGQFLQLDIGPGGYALATLTESDGGGRPTYRILQGPLQSFDVRDYASEGIIGRLSSYFYRVQDSGCIECSTAGGHTVDSGQPGLLRFIDGTHAELYDGVRLLRRYERFPLVTRAVELTAARLSGQRFVLTAGGQSAVVTLEPGSASAVCASAPPEQWQDFQIRFDDPASALAAQFKDLVLEVGTDHNPPVRGKISVLTYRPAPCIRIGFGCLEHAPPPPPVAACEKAFQLFETDDAIRGVAVANAGSDLQVPTRTPRTAARFTGALTLKPVALD